MEQAVNTLLAEAPTGRHLAQFHRDAPALVDAVSLYIEGGLRRGNSVIVVAIPEHVELFLERLAADNFHPDALRSSGQLEIVDAATLLAQVLSSDVPQWAKFRSALDAIMDRVQPFGRGMRVYCELSNLLWGNGDMSAAIRLEELWNALGRTHAFALFCGYVFDTQCENSYAGPLEELGHQFSDILGSPDDERFSVALDRASKELFGIALSQMAGLTKQDGARRFPNGQRTMLWVKRNLPLSTGRLTEQARRYFQASDG